MEIPGLDVAIATTTFSKTYDIRAKLAVRTVKEAVRCGYRIVVVDGGFDLAFRNDMFLAGAILVDETERGMGGSRRQAMRIASRLVGANGAVVWMEPEKHSLVGELWKAVQPIREGLADFVQPARKSLASYPPYQQTTERRGNLGFLAATGIDIDVWFGPRVIGPRALPYFLDYKGEYGDKWESVQIPILRVRAAGLRIMGVTVDYTHPAEQTAAETGDAEMDRKREAQIANIIPALQREAGILGLAGSSG